MPSTQVLAFGPFRLLQVQRVLLEGTRPLRLGKRALEILFALVERAGEVVGKEELIARVWPNTVVDEAALRVHVAALRKVLGGESGARYVENVSGRGYRFVAPLTRLDDSQSEGFARLEAERHAKLPALFSRMIGRSDAVIALAELLPQQRLVTIVGAGGIGKTTVAVATADRHFDSYEDGACFVDLATITDHSLVPAALASALGLAVYSGDPTVALAAFLANRRMLIVLDNCEHVVTAAAQLAESLLRASPGVHILATSREPLLAEGEWVYRLGPLLVPSPSANLSAAEALTFSAIQLFTERAMASLDNFKLDDADVPIVADLCRRLDGIPLAIELAAARLEAFGLRGLATRLEDRLQLLTKGRRTALPRHQTLRAMLDWSYGLLSNAEQIILRRISVFPGSFDLESTRAVVSDGEISALDLFHAVTSLGAKSLITMDVTGEQVLFRLLDTTRVYALEKLRSAGESVVVSQRHAEFFCTVCERARAPSTSTAAWLARFGRTIDDVRAALDWSLSPNGNAAIGAKLTVVSAPIWFQLSIVDEYRRRLEYLRLAFGTTLALDPELEMKLNAMLGYTLMHTKGPSVEMTDVFSRALEIADLHDEAVTRWRALWGLGMAHVAAGDYISAVAISEKTRQRARDLGDEAVVMSERLLALTHHLAGNQTIARRHAECVLNQRVMNGSSFGNDAYQLDHRVAARGVLSQILWLQGFPDQALCTAREAVAEGLSSDHVLSLCFALFCACPVALWVGNMQAANRFVTMLLDHAARHSLSYWLFWGHCFDAALRLREGGMEEPAGRLLDLQRDPLFSAVHREMITTSCQEQFGAGVGAIARPAHWCGPEILRIEGEGILKEASSDVATAEARFRTSLDLARKQGALSWELRAATSLARLWRKQGRGREAHELLSSIYTRFTEGFGTVDVTSARLLLDELVALA
ncbi:winged helix-turn-helix domain-containing protein [Bradyrhizobium sp. Ai1a-2]|uniref:ATP-binding protein n=1 Tax=Bradyrhizobium sp. Ai1a-2 TaxID=196490 RepID=UPI001AEC5C74|nr:winged helix-turn-helix domain-containing protein [Bradyrhizobium sp. Ai1a-2]